MNIQTTLQNVSPSTTLHPILLELVYYLLDLPGISKKRLTGKLGSLSNGVQGSVPAIRKVQQRLDQDLEHRRIDLNSFKVARILHYAFSSRSEVCILQMVLLLTELIFIILT